jgi:hypothetical protein
MNPGHRLLGVLDALIAQRPDSSSIKVSKIWARAFGVNPAAPDHADAISSVTQAVRSELAFARRKLHAAGRTDELLEPAFQRLNDVALPDRYNSEWRGEVGNLTPPEVRKIFLWVAATMERDEDDVDETFVAALLAQTEKLEASASEPHISILARDLAAGQARTIRSALRLRTVNGHKAVGKAVTDLAGTVISTRGDYERDLAQASRATLQVYADLQSTWRATVEVARQTDRTRDTAHGCRAYAAFRVAWDPPGMSRLPPPSAGFLEVVEVPAEDVPTASNDPAVDGTDPDPRTPSAPGQTAEPARRRHQGGS